jgi:hypothetical protein
MGTYKITTDQGSYNVTTDDGVSAQPQVGQPGYIKNMIDEQSQGVQQLAGAAMTPLAKLITGKSFEDMARDQSLASAGNTNFKGMTAPQIQNQLGNVADSSFKNAIGGQIADLATTPAMLLAPAMKYGGMMKDALGVNASNLNDHILSTYSQAVNPSLGKMANPTKLAEFQEKAPQAMKAIVDNADNLQFENPKTGQMESRLPQSRTDALQAAVQTKQRIFDQYNAMQQGATDKGAMVDVPSIAKQALGDIKNSRQYQLYAPDKANEANKVMDRLVESGPATPQDVQNDIAFLNQEMKGYYQKGDYNAANIYANYAANLRSGLDSTVEKALGKGGYQDLKNQYSSLKYVEGDLSKAAGAQLKNSNKGIGESFSNPIALAEMSRGLFTGNIPEFGTGLAIKGYSTAQKMLSNPDWRIAGMFKNISRLKGQ